MQPVSDTTGYEPYSKRAKLDVLTPVQTVHGHLFTKYKISVDDSAFAEKVKGLILELKKLEKTEPYSLIDCLGDPLGAYESIKDNKVISRVLDVFEFGQQRPEWLHQVKKIATEVGKTSIFAPTNHGSLARDSYVLTCNALEKQLQEKQACTEDHLGNILYYADTLITAKSKKPTMQSRFTLALFCLHDLVRKVDMFAEGKEWDNRENVLKLYGYLHITDKSPREYFFAPSDIWTEATLKSAYTAICQMIEENGWDLKMTTHTPSYNQLKAEFESYISPDAFIVEDIGA